MMSEFVRELPVISTRSTRDCSPSPIVHNTLARRFSSAKVTVAVTVAAR